jgi:DNA-binding response OmpR family regulator
MARVLVVSHIAELLQERERILRTAGYEVTTAQSCAAAAGLIGHALFDAALLGFSLPEDERNQLARDLKLANPATKIIMMYFASVRNTELADALIQSNAGPQDILRAVKHILAARNHGRTG